VHEGNRRRLRQGKRHQVIAERRTDRRSVAAGGDNDVLTAVPAQIRHRRRPCARGQRALPQPLAGTRVERVDRRFEEIETVDLGVAVGAGVAFGRLTIDGRYTIGLDNISTDKSDSTKVRNRCLAVLAGFRF
jgi:hypothetical protein